MAVIRTRKESEPSDVVPSGPGSTPAPAPVDRTKSVVKSQVAQPAPRQPRVAGRAAIPGGAPLATSSDSRSFVKDTITELKRVVWPTKDEVRGGTIVTIGLLIFFSLYIFGLDALAKGFFQLLGFYPSGSGLGN